MNQRKEIFCPLEKMYKGEILRVLSCEIFMNFIGKAKCKSRGGKHQL